MLSNIEIRQSVKWR